MTDPTLRIEPMTVADIAAVHEIERASFPVPWPAYAFRQELETNKLARYLVVREGERTVAYGGIWLMVDEAHVTTFAVLPAWRRKGIGALLMLAIMDLSRDVGAREVTLEVRLSNIAARTLYQRFGFRPVGVRPRYYSDNGEDALIMTTDPIHSPAMVARIEGLRDRFAREAEAADRAAAEQAAGVDPAGRRPDARSGPDVPGAGGAEA